MTIFRKQKTKKRVLKRILRMKLNIFHKDAFTDMPMFCVQNFYESVMLASQHLTRFMSCINIYHRLLDFMLSLKC